MSLYRVGKTYYAYVTVKGKRVRQSLGTSDKTEAQQKHDRLKADLWERNESGITLYDAFVGWLKHKQRSVHEKNAIKNFKAAYKDRPLIEVTAASVLEALKDKTPSHYNRIANIVRAAINLAHKSELHDKPAKIARKKSPPGRTEWLTADEWIALDTTLAKWPHAQAMARFGVFTGLRWSNVANLKWRDVDLKRRVAWVHPDEAKAGKPIPVPLSQDAVTVLEGQKGQDKEHVFVWRKHPVQSIKTVWIQARKDAGLEWAKFHHLRHTWASWHVMGGTPLPVLKELGGWASMDMVLRYAHLAPEHLAQFANNATIYAIGTRKKPKNKRKTA